MTFCALARSWPSSLELRDENFSEHHSDAQAIVLAERVMPTLAASTKVHPNKSRRTSAIPKKVTLSPLEKFDRPNWRHSIHSRQLNRIKNTQAVYLDRKGPSHGMNSKGAVSGRVGQE